MKIAALIASLVFTVNAYCQIEFPDGVYLSLEQLRNQKPAFNSDFQVTKYSEINYSLKSNVDSLDKKYIKKKIYGYVRKGSLFINGLPQYIEMEYAMALTKGNFIAFYGRNLNNAAVEAGILTGIVGGLLYYTIERGRKYLYVLSLRTGNMRPLTKEYLLARLADHPNLLDQYNVEPKKDDPDDALLLKYIDLLNQVTDKTFTIKTEFPEGVYLSLEQLRNQKPAFNSDFQVTKYSEINYSLESNVDSLDKKYIKKKIYGYVRKGSLFINGLPQYIDMEYAMALTKGNFIAFYGRNLNNAAVVAGILTGIVGGLLYYTIERGHKYLYVLSLRTGNMRPLTKEYLLARLADHPNLLDQYNVEPKKEDPDDALLLKYIDLLNQIIAN